MKWARLLMLFQGRAHNFNQDSEDTMSKKSGSKKGGKGKGKGC